MAAKPPIVVPQDQTIADKNGQLTRAWRDLLVAVAGRKAAHVPLTGTPATDIAAIRQALIDAGLMEKS